MSEMFEFSLKQLVLNYTAISCWKQSDIDQKVRNILFSNYRLKGQLASYREKVQSMNDWEDLTKDVIKKTDLYVFPVELKAEISYIVREIGLKIYHWYDYVIQNFQNISYVESLVYIEKICWTNNGLIDRVQTLKRIWTHKSNVDVHKVIDPENTITLSEEILQEFQEHYVKYGKCALEVHISLYGKLYNYGFLHTLIDKVMKIMEVRGYNLYNQNQSTDVKMFRWSVYEGFSVSVKHFWSRMTEEERNENVVSCIILSVTRSGEKFEKEACVEISIFLINQLKDDQLQQLFRSRPFSFSLIGISSYMARDYVKDILLKNLLDSWPWQNFYVATIKKIWMSNAEDNNLGSVLKTIANKLKTEHLDGYVIENSVFWNIFQAVWKDCPAHFKNRLAKDDISKVVEALFAAGDISNIKLVISDQKAAEDKIKILLNGVNNKCEALMMENKFELLDQFLEEMQLSEEEIQILKSNIDVTDRVMKNVLLEHESYSSLEANGVFEILDRSLDWKSVTLAERNRFRGRINISEIFWRAISCEAFECLDEFWNWYFDESKNFGTQKLSLKTDPRTLGQVLKEWRGEGDTEVKKMKCDKFLNMIFDSEEEIASFKQVKLKRELSSLAEELIKKNLEDYITIDELLKWCLLPADEIKKIKMHLFDKYIVEICSCKMENLDLHGVKGAISWAFDSEVEMNRFIIEFMMTGKRLQLFYDNLVKEANMIERGFILKGFKKINLDNEIFVFPGFMNFFLNPLRSVNQIEKRYVNNECMTYDEQ